jgi:hypothetical protein
VGAVAEPPVDVLTGGSSAVGRMRNRGQKAFSMVISVQPVWNLSVEMQDAVPMLPGARVDVAQSRLSRSCHPSGPSTGNKPLSSELPVLRTRNVMPKSPIPSSTGVSFPCTSQSPTVVADAAGFCAGADDASCEGAGAVGASRG